MTKHDLIHSLTGILVEVNDVLSRDNAQDDPGKYQQLVALQKHLNDQQLDLIKAQLREDDAGFRTYTGLIQAAIKQLDAEIASEQRIDTIIKTVAQVASNLDDILKAV